MRTISVTVLFVFELVLMGVAGTAANGAVATLATVLCLPIAIYLGILVSRDLSRRDVGNADSYGLLACLIPVIGFLVYVLMCRRHAVTASR